MELQGTSCLPLSLIAPQRKGLAVTWTFGEYITEMAGAGPGRLDLRDQGRGEAKAEHLSPRYTTQLPDIVRVTA